MEVKVFTKGEETVQVGDYVTLEIHLERLNNLKNNKAQFVHSLNYLYSFKLGTQNKKIGI